MKLNSKIVMEIASVEAVIRQAYKDSKGNWTWSVGLTSATGHDVERYIGKPQSMQHCMDIWIWAMQRYADEVSAAFKGHDLTEAQSAAALSFHWNTGAIGRAEWVKKWKSGDVSGAHKGFMNYRSPPDIIDRRKKERDLFFDSTWSGDGKMGEYTRLTKANTPVWGSRVTVDVSEELKRAFEKMGQSDIPTPVQPPKPTTKKDVAEAHLRDSGSRTIKSGDMGQKIAGAGAAISTISVAAQETTGILESIPYWLWPLLAIAGCAGIYWYMRKIKQARVNDHISGVHTGRQENQEFTGENM